MTMRAAKDVIPWRVTDLSLRPFKHHWSMNPALLFDGTTWRCVLRCPDYCMIGGRTIRSPRAGRGALTKNAMLILDPSSWRVVELYKMRENDGLPRGTSDNVGFEDIRLFTTERGGLQGIAASQHLARSGNSGKNPPPQQIVLSFDAEYNISAAQPIRFAENLPQKNWSPFDRSVEPRFLYSIREGTLIGLTGKLETGVLPFAKPMQVTMTPPQERRERARKRAVKYETERASRSAETTSRVREGSGDFGPLRGGSQLVQVAADTWLGIGHQMRLVRDFKLYVHVWYLVDGRGKMRAESVPMKLAPNNYIEFAAGLAVDGDRVVVSFGVDDAEAKIGETSLSAVMGMLRA